MKKEARTRDINPFGLRMQSDLKERLDREAKISGRSLNAEIVHRLLLSFDNQDGTKGSYTASQLTAPSYTPDLNDIERQLLSIFRRLPVEKQLALLSLFK